MKTKLFNKIDELTIACAEIEAREYRKKALNLLIELRDMVNDIYNSENSQVGLVGTSIPNFNEFSKAPKTKTHGCTPSPENPTSPKKKEFKVENSDALLKQVQNCGLSFRTYNCLRRDKIYSISSVVEKTEDDLLKIKNFGRTCLNEVEEFLLKNNLSLKV